MPYCERSAFGSRLERRNENEICVAARITVTNDGRRLHGQVDLRAEVLGLHGVCGIPLTIRGNEWQPEELDWLDSDEIRALKKSTQSIEEFISGVLIDAVRATLPPEALWVFAD